jgi:hypothetical protein
LANPKFKRCKTGQDDRLGRAARLFGFLIAPFFAQAAHTLCFIIFIMIPGTTSLLDEQPVIPQTALFSLGCAAFHFARPSLFVQAAHGNVYSKTAPLLDRQPEYFIPQTALLLPG